MRAKEVKTESSLAAAAAAAGGGGESSSIPLAGPPIQRSASTMSITSNEGASASDRDVGMVDGGNTDPGEEDELDGMDPSSSPEQRTPQYEAMDDDRGDLFGQVRAIAA